MTIKTGNFVSDYVYETAKMDNTVSGDAVQPNGVELTVKEVQWFHGIGTLNNEDYKKPRLKGYEFEDVPGAHENLSLKTGHYLVRYKEAVEIPENCVGYVVPRSRVMRCGCMLFSALWDSGYKGSGYGGLVVGNDVEIESGFRIGQFVLMEADSPADVYDGSHQHENLEDYTGGGGE